MNKLIIMIIGQNCEETINMCLESVKSADKIWYLDGGSSDNTMKIVKDFLFENKYGGYLENKYGGYLENKWDNNDREMNGKQRNFYLNYLKQNYLNDWCLVLDADEVLEDYGIEKIKQFIENESNNEPALISPRIHHFIGDLGHEDATKDIHYVPNRLFKIVDSLFYPLGAHPVLQGINKNGTINVHIWHFRECLGIFTTNKKHVDNWDKSEMHPKGYLLWWYYAMLFGNYPRKQVYYGSLPIVIKRRFRI